MKRTPTVAAIGEAVLASLIFVGLLGLSTFLVYNKSINALEQEIKIGLVSNVKASATTLNGDLHQQISAQTRRDDPVYQKLAVSMEKLREASRDVRYIYTCILRNGQVMFVVNPSPQNDGGPAPALMEVYDHAPPELIEALAKHQPGVSVTPYRDQWGTFISAYAPFYTSTGEFGGVLAMDLELSSFYQRLEKIDMVFRKANITILFLGLIVGLTVWWIRRHSQQLKMSLHDLDIQCQQLRHSSEQANIPRLLDWQVPLLFLQSPVVSPYQPLQMLPVAVAERGEPGAVQEQSLALWWDGNRDQLLPCPASRLVIDLPDVLDACFDADSMQRVWRQTFRIWRGLAEVPLTIEVGLQEEELKHWWVSIRLAAMEGELLVAEPVADWWEQFLSWQAYMADQHIRIVQVGQRQLVLAWWLPKYEGEA